MICYSKCQTPLEFSISSELILGAWMVQWCGCGLDDLRFETRQGKSFLLAPKCPGWLWDPPSPLVKGYWLSFPGGVKWQVHEADCIPASSVEVKNERSYTSASQLCLHAMYWDNCTFFYWAYVPSNSSIITVVYLLLQYVFLYSTPVIVHCYFNFICRRMRLLKCECSCVLAQVHVYRCTCINSDMVIIILIIIISSQSWANLNFMKLVCGFRMFITSVYG